MLVSKNGQADRPILLRSYCLRIYTSIEVTLRTVQLGGAVVAAVAVVNPSYVFLPNRAHPTTTHIKKSKTNNNDN